MVEYEIPTREAETYIHHFMQVIIIYLKENDPDKTLEMFLGDMEKEIGSYFATLESKMELVLNKISELSKEKIITYSIADIDVQIRRETKYKRIEIVDKEYVAYSETTHGFGNVYPRIFFSSNEKIILARKDCRS